MVIPKVIVLYFQDFVKGVWLIFIGGRPIRNALISPFFGLHMKHFFQQPSDFLTTPMPCIQFQAKAVYG